ncbi:MAG TPA: hypothetical protein VFA74_17990 [Terriglobales bacterium]|nr:hypothetical protein [Terriglobales bacterium]
MTTEVAVARDTAAGHIECDPAEFRQKFNKRSFELSHHLSGHPLFQIPRLIELSKTLASTGSVYYDAGEVRVDQRWDESPAGSWSVDETIRRIQDAGAWIILRRAEQDPEYGALLDECMDEIQTLLGKNLKREMKVQDAIVFITSPNRVTSYHIDRECNFILQIHGEKDISVFDKDDRVVLTEEEIERFWMVDNNAAVYKEQFQSRAKVYRMGPGKAIHVPVNAPHWVKNDNNISVTLSVNFQFRENFPAHVYRANYLLRKAGLAPTPPGKSTVRDGLKMFAMNATYVPARGVRRLFHKIRP